MNRLLKILSVLLSYPGDDLIAARQEISDEVRRLAGSDRALVDCFRPILLDLADLDVFDLQERYVRLFDRTRMLSLHLFEHVHGESRDRGQAMVDLKEMYERDGMMISASEMPDYLPLFLEYLSLKGDVEAQDLLGQTLHIVTAIRERLADRSPSYAGLFGAIERIARAKADPKLLSELRAVPEDDPDDLAALDRVWEEEAVTFGGNAGDAACGPDRLRSQIRAARRPAPQSPGHAGGERP